MTERKLLAKRHVALPEKRDLIFFGIAITILVLFVGKASEFNLIGKLQVMAISMAYIGIVAAGQTIVVITGGIDLSVGSLVSLTSVVAALLINAEFSPWIGVLLALIMATAIGAIHGTLISYYNLAPFIVTFGSLSLVRGLAQVLSGGSPINLHTDAFQGLWVNAFGLVPIPTILMLLAFFATAYLLRNSRFGRYVYAIGSNETVARLSGINVNQTRQLAYAASGLLAGIAGILLMTWIEAGTYSNGQEYGLLSIAAVIIGGTSFRGGNGGVWGTLGGVLVLSMVNNGLVLFSVPPLWNDVISGAIIIAAGLIDIQRKRLQESVPAPLSAPLSAPTVAASTLDQAVNHYVQTLQERYGYGCVRLYLLDRDTGDLLDPLTQTTPEGTLAPQVYQTGRSLYMNDLGRERSYSVTPAKPDIQAAAAIPILHQQRVIGVAELQCAKADVFGEVMLESIMAFSTQMAGQLEDNWLLEGGWLSRQVRESLRNLSDDVYLDKSPLGDWLISPNGRTNRGEILRHMLLEAINHLQPEHADPQSRPARRHQILKQTYIDQKNVDLIIHDLGLSRRQYFYDLKEVVDAVTHWLVTHR